MATGAGGQEGRGPEPRRPSINGGGGGGGGSGDASGGDGDGDDGNVSGGVGGGAGGSAGDSLSVERLENAPEKLIYGEY